MIPTIDTDQFDRNYVALLATFKPDSLELDPEAYRNLVAHFTHDQAFVDHGGALVVNPEAGEVFYLTPEERAATIRVALECRPDGMPVFAGCYGIRREEILESALQAKHLGVDGIFVMPPTGTMEVSTSLDGARNPEIWRDHVRAIADATELPLIVHPSHPFTSRWAVGLPIESVKLVLEAVPSVVGWKMIYGPGPGHHEIAGYLRSLPRHVGILNAHPLAYHTCLVRGIVDGALSGGYNFLKEALIEHAAAWKRGDLARVIDVYNGQLMPINGYIYSDLSRLHIRYKLAAWLRGLLPHPYMRPPMPQPRRAEAEDLYQAFEALGLLGISASEFDDALERADEIRGAGARNAALAI